MADQDSFNITELFSGHSELLKTVPSEVQFVEGFSGIASAFYNPMETKDLRPYGSYSSGWRSAPYWVDSENIPVTWKSAAVPKVASTIFAFVASSINAPVYNYPPPRATLFVNGEFALEFWLGIRTRKFWKNGEYAMEFFPKRVQLPTDGLNRWRYDEEGNSGVYLLSVPAAVVKAGKPVQLSVQVSDEARNDAHQFFMIWARKDVLSLTLRSVAQELGQLRGDIIQMKRAIAGLARRAYPECWPDLLRTESAVLYTDGYKHLCSPEILRTKSGKFILLAREGIEHGGTYGQVISLESYDPLQFDPKTKRVIVDNNTSDPTLSQLTDGTLLMTWFEQSPECCTFVARSEDEGKTWLEPVRVDGVLSDGRIIELANGELLAPYYKYDQPLLYISVDRGKTWKLLYSWPKINSTFPETSLARFPSGRLVAVVRYKDDNLHTSISEDNGRSWTPPQRTPMNSQHHRGRLTALSTGELLCSFGWRCRGAEFPDQQAQDDLSTIRVAVSFDEGETWRENDFRFIRHDILNWDIGYPDTLEMPDGKLYTVYWTNRFKRYFVFGHLYERWF